MKVKKVVAKSEAYNKELIEILRLSEKIGELSEKKNSLLYHLAPRLNSSTRVKYKGKTYSCSIRDNSSPTKWGQFVYISKYSFQKREVKK